MNWNYEIAWMKEYWWYIFQPIKVIRSDFFGLILQCAWLLEVFRYIWWNLKFCNFAFFERRFWHFLRQRLSILDRMILFLANYLQYVKKLWSISISIIFAFHFLFTIAWLFTSNFLGNYNGKVLWNWTMILFLEFCDYVTCILHFWHTVAIGVPATSRILMADWYFVQFFIRIPKI